MFWLDGEDLRHLLRQAWERANSLRLPPDVDFSWRSAWPVPLYGVACVAHWRFRALKPRRLPTLTTLGLPELYGIFALGHVAQLEANRLRRKAKEHSGLDYILGVARWARGEYLKYPQLFTAPSSSRLKENLDYTSLLMNRPVGDFEVWKFNLCRSWASKRARKAASYLLHRRMAIATPEHVPYRDLGIVTLFISEELEGNSLFRPSFLRDEKLMLEFAWLMSVSAVVRWGGTFKGLLRTNAILQRYFIYLLAFKWLGGRYCHYASLFGLEKAPLIAFQASLSRMDWERKTWRMSGSGGSGDHIHRTGVEGADTA